MGKLQVNIIGSPDHCRLKKGDQGYIDGYVRGGDDRPYAVVVCRHIIEMIPLHALEVVL